MDNIISIQDVVGWQQHLSLLERKNQGYNIDFELIKQIIENVNLFALKIFSSCSNLELAHKFDYSQKSYIKYFQYDLLLKRINFFQDTDFDFCMSLNFTISERSLYPSDLYIELISLRNSYEKFLYNGRLIENTDFNYLLNILLQYFTISEKHFLKIIQDLNDKDLNYLSLIHKKYVNTI